MSEAKAVVQLSPLRRTGGPLNHAVYDLLKERLLEGDYAAGTRLPTDDLRLELGVSKQPVMEALRRLSADGMIEIVPQVGCIVTDYGPDLSDFLINTTGVPQPLSSALDDRHAEHERIRGALQAGDQPAARAEMERHIITTAAVIHADTATLSE